MAPKRLNPSSALLLAWDVAADDEDKRTDVRGVFINGVRPLFFYLARARRSGMLGVKQPPALACEIPPHLHTNPNKRWELLVGKGLLPRLCPKYRSKFGNVYGQYTSIQCAQRG